MCMPERSFKYKIQYEIHFVWPWQFERHARQICKSKQWLNHTTINNYPKLCMHRNISKMVDQSRPVNDRMHYVVITVTSSGCLKLSQSIRTNFLTCTPMRSFPSFILSLHPSIIVHYFILTNILHFFQPNTILMTNTWPLIFPHRSLLGQTFYQFIDPLTLKIIHNNVIFCYF